MLATNLFCGAVHCGQCVESADVCLSKGRFDKFIEDGQEQNDEKDHRSHMMDEMILNHLSEHDEACLHHFQEAQAQLDRRFTGAEEHSEDDANDWKRGSVAQSQDDRYSIFGRVDREADSSNHVCYESRKVRISLGKEDREVPKAILDNESIPREHSTAFSDIHDITSHNAPVPRRHSETFSDIHDTMSLRMRSFSDQDLGSILNEETEAIVSQGFDAKLQKFLDPKTARISYPSLLGSARSDEKRRERHAQVLYLDDILQPGDVLAVADGRQVTHIGGHGGMFGHVMVVKGEARCIHRHTPEAMEFIYVWPRGKVRRIYVVPVMESTRASDGIHEVDLLLNVDPRSGRVVILGEVDDKGTILAYESPSGVPEEVGIWQCPPELRNSFCDDLKDAVMDEMRQNRASWSWGTAVRAFLLPAEMQREYLTPAAQSESRRQQLLKEIQECWKSAPICTSLPIIFGQRYLHEFSQSGYATEAPLDTMSPIDMIMMYMPLKSDRTLPGELLKFLWTSGWTNTVVLPMRTGTQSNLAVPKWHSR